MLHLLLTRLLVAAALAGLLAMSIDTLYTEVLPAVLDAALHKAGATR